MRNSLDLQCGALICGTPLIFHQGCEATCVGTWRSDTMLEFFEDHGSGKLATPPQLRDLHNNSLQGPIPGFLGSLPNLKILNIANNQFNGTIPVSISTKNGLLLTAGGNPGLCTSNISCPIPTVAQPPENSSVRTKKNILELLIAAVIPSIFVL